MLEEYTKPVSRESWLTDAERNKMSAENRGDAAEVYAKSKIGHDSAAKLRREKAERVKYQRMKMSEANLRLAKGEKLPEKDAPPKERDSGIPAVPKSESAGYASAKPDAEKAHENHEEKKQAEGKPQKVTEERAEATAGKPKKRAVRGGRFGAMMKPHWTPNRITVRGTLTIGLLGAALVGMVIYGKVQTNEAYTQIAELQAEYNEICARNVSMKSEMEGKMTVKNIESYAENVLGLKQLDQSQIAYIRIQTEDEVHISEPKSNWIMTINDFFSSLWDFLRGA